MGTQSARPGRVRRVAVLALVSGLALLVLEGFSSSVLFAYDLATKSRRPLAERAHTRPDPELGWVNLESHRSADLYGPGRNLTTNARGFRGTREYADRVPDGVLRAICVGDSFTLGYGVADDETWPARMEALDPALECPNMGQGGYGLDQAYLWYRRDGLRLGHHAVVLAFIDDDFRRLQYSRFSGYDKPQLALRETDGAIHVRNAPVSDAGQRHPWLVTNGHLLARVRTFELVRRALGRSGAASAETGSVLPEDESERIATALFDDLARSSGENGRTLLLVHLPRRSGESLGGLTRLEGWARRAADAAVARGAHLLDLYDEFERHRGEGRDRLFLGAGALDFPGAEGHYTAAGNQLVAERVLERLRDASR